MSTFIEPRTPTTKFANRFRAALRQTELILPVKFPINAEVQWRLAASRDPRFLELGLDEQDIVGNPAEERDLSRISTLVGKNVYATFDLGCGGVHHLAILFPPRPLPFAIGLVAEEQPTGEMCATPLVVDDEGFGFTVPGHNLSLDQIDNLDLLGGLAEVAVEQAIVTAARRKIRRVKL
jgi:hypothetical protein